MKIHPGRLIHLDGTDNFRDLGGYKNKNGLTVKWGKLYRSGRLNNLSESDHEIISILKIKTIVDFRRKDEIEKHPNILPVENKINSVNLPITSGVNGAGLTRQILAGEKNIDVDGHEMMLNAYTFYSTKAQEEYKEFFRLLLKSDNCPLLFHCTAGKDRTGFAAAMLLSALDIPKEIIFEDYLLTNHFRKVFNEEKMAGAENDTELEIIKSFVEVRNAYLEKSFQEIEQLSGSVENYLFSELKLGSEEINQLKRNFLE
ncbi:MAG: hypothetical protein CMO01_11045 [Thalassobius sp.]|nr:hypothetical protein [Thalassovita sp.]